MTEQATREAFEAWATEGGKYPQHVERDHTGGYNLNITRVNWLAWTAAVAWAKDQLL